MAISEDRVHFLLPRSLKQAASAQARRLNLSVGEYIRRLLKADLDGGDPSPATSLFPFGKNPIHTGRTLGSVVHNQPE